MLKVHTSFPRTWLISSNIALEMGFPKSLGLEVILYSYSIRDFPNSRPINYSPWSNLMYIGLGYLDSHKVSTKLAIVIALLSSYSKTSNHPVTGSIILTAFRCKFYFLPLRRTP